MTQLKKSLGLFDSIALLVGITIGSGIFATPQIIAGYLDSFSTIYLHGGLVVPKVEGMLSPSNHTGSSR